MKQEASHVQKLVLIRPPDIEANRLVDRLNIRKHSAVLHLRKNNMAAAGGNHLSNGRVNVGLLRECARRELLQCLNKQPGSKVTRKFLYLHVTYKLQCFRFRLMYGV